jgi:Rrf2 family protein
MQSSRFAVAVHLMALAHTGPGGLPEERITSERMARSVNTNPVVVRRILGSLRDAGLVASQPGPGGGWRLLRPPEDISLLDVLTAVEGESGFSLRTRPANAFCPVGANMPSVLAGYFRDAEAAMERYLDQVSIADVLQAIRDGTDHLLPGAACHVPATEYPRSLVVTATAHD